LVIGHLLLVINQMLTSSHLKLADLTLASMQIPEAIATVTLTLKGQTEEAVTTTLLLHPGEPGEIMMQLRNQSDRPLRWVMDVKGDFPDSWCDWQQGQPEELVAQHHCDRAIRFQVSEDFLEDLLTLNHSHPRLQLDYDVYISVYIENDVYSPLLRNGLLDLRLHQRYNDVIHFTRAGGLLV
jgi:hypothetical protein